MAFLHLTETNYPVRISYIFFCDTPWRAIKIPIYLVNMDIAYYYKSKNKKNNSFRIYIKKKFFKEK